MDNKNKKGWHNADEFIKKIFVGAFNYIKKPLLKVGSFMGTKPLLMLWTAIAVGSASSIFNDIANTSKGAGMYELIKLDGAQKYADNKEDKAAGTVTEHLSNYLPSKDCIAKKGETHNERAERTREGETCVYERRKMASNGSSGILQRVFHCDENNPKVIEKFTRPYAIGNNKNPEMRNLTTTFEKPAFTLRSNADKDTFRRNCPNIKFF